jgi:predicted cupin superfamily sugar epimerase
MARKPSAEDIIERLGLKPHPEGGFYRETYRCAEGIPQAALPARFKGPRSFCTAILFLLPEGSFSRLHRLACDELWHYHLGAPLIITEIRPGGAAARSRLGPDIRSGDMPQAAIPAGSWFGARPVPGKGWSLVGATVAPGFEFSDFELAEAGALLEKFPGARDAIEDLT